MICATLVLCATFAYAAAPISGSLSDLRGVASADWQPAPSHQYVLAVSATEDTTIDERLADLTKLDPKARVLFLLEVGASAAWCKAHPNDVVKYSAVLKPAPAPAPSLCSKAWLEIAEQDVAALVGHLEGKWGAHALGYAICRPGGGEWTFPTQPHALSDYSVVAIRAFREYLRAKYRTLPDFREAWGQARNPVVDMNKAPKEEVRPILSWGDVKIPAPKRRRHPPEAVLEPPAFTDLVDYRQFAAKTAAASALAILSAARKKAAHKPLGVVAADWMRSSSEQDALGLNLLLGARPVDFVVLRKGDALQLYAARGVGHALPDPAKPQAWTGTPSPASLNEGAATLAVVVDANSAAYMARPGQFVDEQLAEIEKAGVSFRVYALEDLIDRGFPAEKTVLFLNAFVLDKNQREILSTIKGGGRTLIFVYADGAMRPDRGVDGRDIRDFTGIAVTMLPKDAPVRIKVTGGLAPWTTDLGEDVVYGSKETIRPGFCVVDDNADVLGLIDGLKMPGLVDRRFEDWTSIYSAAPVLPADVLKGLVNPH